MTRAAGTCAACIVLVASYASAQPAENDPPQVVEAPEAASGVLVPAEAPTPWLWVPRIALAPVRGIAVIAFAPLRGGAWLLSRYKLRARVKQWLFSDDGTFGMYPTALFETGLGLNVGAHLIDTDLAGHRERLSLSAGYGGTLKQRYDANLGSGRLLGDTTITMRGSFRAWNLYNFFGVGNSTSDVQTRFAQHVWHGEVAAKRDVAGPLSAQVIAAYSARTFDPHADPEGLGSTGDLYDPMSLVGFAHGTNSVYGELELCVDTREVANRYISTAAPSSGWLASAFVGATKGVAGDPSRYLQYGFDAWRFIDVYHGDRVLVVRGSLEAVTAHDDAIPVVDLPRLGGASLLRGFPEDRFRDRIATLASLEYRFPIQEGVIGYGFVDAGRVANVLADLGVRGWHVGEGGGLQLQTLASFLVRFQVAHSTEGTFFDLAFDPGIEVRARQRRL